MRCRVKCGVTTAREQSLRRGSYELLRLRRTSLDFLVGLCVPLRAVAAVALQDQLQARAQGLRSAFADDDLVKGGIIGGLHYPLSTSCSNHR